MRVELGVWQLDAAVLRREPQDGVELALADGALDQAIEKLAVLGSCALPQVAGGHVDDHVAREFGPLYQAFELVGLAAELGETGIKSGNAIGRTGFSQSRFSLAAAVAAGQRNGWNVSLQIGQIRGAGFISPIARIHLLICGTRSSPNALTQ